MYLEESQCAALSTDSESFWTFFRIVLEPLFGRYTAAFALARKPSVSATTRAKIAAAFATFGSAADMCTVDTRCFDPRAVLV